MSEQVKQPSVKIGKGRIFFYVLTLAALVIVYINFDELSKIRDVFITSNGYWLIPILVSQSAFYYFMALNYQAVLRVKNLEVPVKDLYPVAIVIQFFNQALPSVNISGQAFFIYYLRKFKLPLAEGIGRVILEMMTLYMAFGVFFFVSVVLMGRRGIFVNHPETLIFVYVFIALAILMTGIFFAVQRTGDKKSKLISWLAKRLHKHIGRFGMGNSGGLNKLVDHAGHVDMFIDQFKSTLSITSLNKKSRPFWFAFLWQHFALFAHVSVFYFAARAIGTPISIEVAFITFTLTKFVAMLSFVPGAIGVFEVTATVILVAFGMDKGSALGIALLSRAFIFWLPMPIGWMLYQNYIKAPEQEVPET